MNDATHAARDAGKKRLSKTKLDGFLARYDALVAEGLSANPAPEHHKRNYLERDSYNLACALRDLRTEATRFAVDLSVPMTNNEAERSLRMAKIHRKVSGCFQSKDGARHFAAIRSYIATARKHDVGALELLGRLFRGDAWMPPSTTCAPRNPCEVNPPPSSKSLGRSPPTIQAGCPALSARPCP